MTVAAPVRSVPAFDLDANFMAAALALGTRERGRTWPNPSVGAVAGAA